VREVLAPFEDSPERQEALRLVADRLDLPKETQAGLAPRRGAVTGTVSPKLLEAGDRLERDALAGCLAHPELVHLLAELAPEHFDDERHRRLQTHLVDPGEPDAELLPLLAELDARAAAEGIDEDTGKELLLRLRERKLKRELAGAQPARVRELQDALDRIRAAIEELSWLQSAGRTGVPR